MPKGVYKRKPKLTQETTGHQTVSYSFGDGLLNRDYTKVGTYTELRTVRKDPTVQLARALLISCMQAGSWNIEVDEGVPDEVKEFVEHILPLREDFLYNAIAYGKVDFGWIGFEKIFTLKDGRIIIDGLKPLLHDMTNILVTGQGRFNGYRQVSIGSSGLQPSLGSIGPAYPLDIPLEKCLHIAFAVEAGYLYGMPLLENIRQSMDMWKECNDGARKYDKKVAGVQPLIEYPTGQATIDGETANNHETAVAMNEALVSGGGVVVPKTTLGVDSIPAILNETQAGLYAWKISYLETKGKIQAHFIDRLKYLDTQKVRGLGFPERAILEGQYGTKAEAAVQGDWAILNMEATDRAIVGMLNRQLVNQLLQLNFGDALVDKVRIVAAPLVDKQISFIRDLYKGLKDADIDMKALREKVGIPTKEGGSEGLKKQKQENDDEN